MTRPDGENDGAVSSQAGPGPLQRRGIRVSFRTRPLRGSTSRMVTSQRRVSNLSTATQPFAPGNDASAAGTAAPNHTDASVSTASV